MLIGNAHKPHGPPGIAPAAQHGADGVIAADKDVAQHADGDILHGELKRWLRRLQKAQKRAQHRQHACRKRQRHACKHGERGADGALYFAVFPLAGILPDDDGAAQRKAGDEAGDDLCHLRAGGNGGHALGPAEGPHHEQVCRAVQRLQHVGNKKRAGKAEQRPGCAALRQVVCIHRQGPPFLQAPQRMKGGSACRPLPAGRPDLSKGRTEPCGPAALPRRGTLPPGPAPPSGAARA